ncbi:YozQ family protein [Paenibacillus sp. BSR1-1]|uniref:YozQ family protein n=1 Tax=Paenibacillus sp. BSR1-1 TaxID=3020845 RepID=UPI0025B1A91A|nr:YozQ family protein [Paenibacillus sp. BSR1-1]MDN3019237.1 YozQ family protein [Paenibacillus sp. BSR1-1]
MDKQKQKANPDKEVAGSFYHPSYYQEKDQISSGLATTHEQVSDVYAEGDVTTGNENESEQS